MVHFTEDGTIYTNRVANKGKIRLIHKDKTGPNKGKWKDQAGNDYPLALPSDELDEQIAGLSTSQTPALTIEPLVAITTLCGLGRPGTTNWGVPDGSGIEFRMHTKQGGSSAPRMGRSSVTVYAPSKASGNILVDDPTGSRDKDGVYQPFGCKSDIQKDNPSTLAVEPYGETPYIYLGGWGGVDGGRVDAGLQFNCPTSTTTDPSNPEYPYRDFTLSLFFFREDQNGVFTAINDFKDNRFASGQSLELRFNLSPQISGVNPISYTPLIAITAVGLNAARTATQTKTITTVDNSWDIWDG